MCLYTCYRTDALQSKTQYIGMYSIAMRSEFSISVYRVVHFCLQMVMCVYEWFVLFCTRKKACTLLARLSAYTLHAITYLENKLCATYHTLLGKDCVALYKRIPTYTAS